MIHNQDDAVNPAQRGTKACAWYRFDLAPGQSETIRMRLTERTEPTRLIHDFDGLIATRIVKRMSFTALRRPLFQKTGSGFSARLSRASCGPSSITISWSSDG